MTTASSPRTGPHRGPRPASASRPRPRCCAAPDRGEVQAAIRQGASPSSPPCAPCSPYLGCRTLVVTYREEASKLMSRQPPTLRAQPSRAFAAPFGFCALIPGELRPARRHLAGRTLDRRARRGPARRPRHRPAASARRAPGPARRHRGGAPAGAAPDAPLVRDQDRGNHRGPRWTHPCAAPCPPGVAGSSSITGADSVHGTSMAHSQRGGDVHRSARTLPDLRCWCALVHPGTPGQPSGR